MPFATAGLASVTADPLVLVVVCDHVEPKSKAALISDSENGFVSSRLPMKFDRLPKPAPRFPLTVNDCVLVTATETELEIGQSSLPHLGISSNEISCP